uniref:Uncharacterized protein n=1 Tax=Rhodnius prolixus TaxID=13249 RepID=T1HQ72_RHOPR
MGWLTEGFLVPSGVLLDHLFRCDTINMVPEWKAASTLMVAIIKREAILCLCQDGVFHGLYFLVNLAEINLLFGKVSNYVLCFSFSSYFVLLHLRANLIKKKA